MKFLKYIIIFLFVVSCGYQPMLVINQSDFKYNNIDLKGNPDISRKISKNIQYLKDEEAKINIILDVSFEKLIVSKNKKGNPEIFNMQIQAILTVVDNGKNVVNKFRKNTSYNNKSNKFELKQYENSLKNNLIEKISEDILIFLQSYS